MFAGALLIGGLCSLVYCSRSLLLVVAARCLWGGCWSVLRLTGMVTVTDCIEAGLAQENNVGRLTGLYSGLSRLGSALGMALGGALSDRISFEAFFGLAAMLTLCAPQRLHFGPSPGMHLTLEVRHPKQLVGWCGIENDSAKSHGATPPAPDRPTLCEAPRPCPLTLAGARSGGALWVWLMVASCWTIVSFCYPLLVRTLSADRLIARGRSGSGHHVHR